MTTKPAYSFQTACRRLDIMDPDPSDELIKKHYRLKALQYHPDKNKSPNASKDFQEVHEAYQYLLKYNDGECFLHDDQSESHSSYANVLLAFLNNILGEESKNQLFTIILQRLSSKCEMTLINTLARLDKVTLLKLHDIVKKFGEVLHLPDSIVKKLEDIIANKHRGDECVLLNPTLNDLFENNLYKLTVDGFVYIVPLWHHELIYDHSGNDVIVKCYPMLDENIYIDAENNVHVEVIYDIQDLWGKETVTVTVCSKTCTILVNQIRLTQFQTIAFANIGISQINPTNVYDISKRGDILVHIELELVNKGK